MAAVDVPAQVCARSALGERGQLWARDTGYPSRRARERLCFAHHEHRAFLFRYSLPQTRQTDLWRQLFGFDEKNYYRDVLVLCAYIVGFAGCVLAVVWIWVRETR